MSRIRSIHPGLWTDEEFVGLSAFARLMFMGVWNECDDKGTFAWSPLKLKMRLLPADNVDAADLLAEMEAAGCVRRYEIDGKSYGAVRNFCKFQRPKKPNDIHPSTPEILAFCAFVSEQADTDGGEVPHQFPTNSEKSPQMEEGGGRMEERKKKNDYAFAGQIVRLTPSDRDQWRSRFHAIADLDAELHTLDAWLRGQPAAKQKDWFIVGAGWLNRRHQENLGRSRTEPAMPIC